MYIVYTVICRSFGLMGSEFKCIVTLISLIFNIRTWITCSGSIEVNHAGPRAYLWYPEKKITQKSSNSTSSLPPRAPTTWSRTLRLWEGPSSRCTLQLPQHFPNLLANKNWQWCITITTPRKTSIHLDAMTIFAWDHSWDLLSWLENGNCQARILRKGNIQFSSTTVHTRMESRTRNRIRNWWQKPRQTNDKCSLYSQTWKYLPPGSRGWRAC